MPEQVKGPNPRRKIILMVKHVVEANILLHIAIKFDLIKNAERVESKVVKN
jgi:hypothetical protein